MIQCHFISLSLSLCLRKKKLTHSTNGADPHYLYSSHVLKNDLIQKSMCLCKHELLTVILKKEGFRVEPDLLRSY